MIAESWRGLVAAGKDLSQFVQEILRYFRNLLVCKTANTTDLLHLPEEETNPGRRVARDVRGLQETLPGAGASGDHRLSHRV